MSLRRSLCAYVPWTELAAVLGIHLKDSSLPAHVDCPMCSGRMSVWEDTTKSSSWHHCFDCGSSGDLIELASSVWEINLEDTIAKLAREGLPLPPEEIVPDRIKDYAEGHPGREARFAAMWKASQDFFARKRSATVQALREKFRLHCDVSDVRWAAGAGQCLGSMTRDVVERTFSINRTQRWPNSYGGEYVLKGRAWQDVMAIPYHDMPEHLSAFFFVGRQGTAKDVVFRRITRRRPEFGLAGLPLAMATGGDVVAVENPLLMARIHCRQTALSATVLPFVSWHDGPGGCTSAAYRCLGARKVVFWDWEPGCKTWMQAIRANGYLCTMGPETPGQKTFDHYLRLNTPADLHKKLCRKAVPWREALSAHIETNGDAWTESLFARFKENKIDVSRILPDLSRSARDRVLRVACERAPERTATVDKHKIIETDDGWFCVSPALGRVCVSSFVFKLDSIEVDGKVTYYVGRLVRRGKETPFRAASGQLASRPAIQYQAAVLRGQLGPFYIRAGWAAKLARLAEAFSPPAEDAPGVAQEALES